MINVGDIVRRSSPLAADRRWKKVIAAIPAGGRLPYIKEVRYNESHKPLFAVIGVREHLVLGRGMLVGLVREAELAKVA